MKKVKILAPAFLLLFAVLSDPPGKLFGAESEGIIKPFREATLSLSVLERIDKVVLDEGDRVEDGDIILRLDDRLQMLEVERRKLQADNKAEITLARRRATILEEEAEATSTLYETSRNVSREEMNRKNIEAGMAQAEVEQLENREKLEALELKMAEQELDSRRLKAPFAGIVTDILVEQGEVSQPGQPLVHLVDLSRCYLESLVEARYSFGLREGETLTVRVPRGLAWVELEATIDHISAVVDPASGLRKIRVAFDNPGEEITPGLTGTIQGLRDVPVNPDA